MSPDPRASKRAEQAYPLRSERDIERIRRSIRTKKRDLLLFDLALETGATAGRILRLRVKDLAGLNVGDDIPALGSKPGHSLCATVGPKSYETFQQCLLRYRPNLNDPLFKSRKGKGALSLPSASRLVRGWFENIGLENMSGFLSLRKTWELRRLQRVGIETPPLAPHPGLSGNDHHVPTTLELFCREMERAIVTARFKPGDRLTVEPLAEQFRVSKAMIRKAIGWLADRNFLTRQPRKGAIVRELSEQHLKEIVEIRLMLELPAAKKAASVATPTDIETLERFNRQYQVAQQAHNIDIALANNEKFHFTIYKLAGMPLLLPVIKNIWDQVCPYYHLMFRQRLVKDQHTGRVYHNKVIEGMRESDPRKTSSWLEIELVETTNFAVNLMRTMQRDGS